MAVKYQWLAEQLRDLIRKDLEKGVERLPTENELCSRYKVSRQTVRMSLSLLEKDGLIQKKHGSGSYLTGLLLDPKKNKVGILISSDQEYIYPGLIHAIQTTLSQNGFFAQVFVTGNNISTERTILLQLLKESYRGLIIEGCKSSLPNPNLDLYHQLIHQGIKLLFLHNYYPALPQCCYLKENNSYGSALLVQHLAAHGHTSIAGIFQSDQLQGIERYQGLMETMRDLKLPLSDSSIGWFHTRDLTLLETQHDTGFLKHFIRDSLPSCTAVICYHDEIAYWLVQELKAAGYQLPRDMAVASFDNTYLSNSITSLSHQHNEMGIKSAQMLLNLLKGLPVNSQEISWTLMPKRSTSYFLTPDL